MGGEEWSSLNLPGGKIQEDSEFGHLGSSEVKRKRWREVGSVEEPVELKGESFKCWWGRASSKRR